MLKLIILSVLFLSIRSLPTHFGLDPHSGNFETNPASRIMATGCPSNADYKYPNGSCLSTCPSPHQIQMDQGSAFCNPPCPGQFYDTAKGTCLDSCERFFDRFEDGIRYCDITLNCYALAPWHNPTRACSPPCSDPHFPDVPLPDGSYDCVNPCEGRYFDVFSFCIDSCEAQYIRVEGDMTYCDKRAPNPNQCPNVFERKYPNGTCLPSCPEPWRGVTDDNGYYECNPPCEQGQYYDSIQWTCLDSCDSQYIKVEDNIIYCDPFTPCSSKYEYKYANGSCLDSCPSPGYTMRFRNGAFFCDVPCPTGQYHDQKYQCVDSCDGEIKRRGEIRYCINGSNMNTSEKSYSSKVEIYLRYDIALADFNSQNYLAKFLGLLSTFLEDEDSDIKIIDIREGSTIIESQVTLKSSNQNSMKTKTAALNTKLTNAAKSNGLNLEGINVLNSRFSVVLPEENDDDSNSSSVKKIAIGVGVGLVSLAIAIGAYLLYRHKKKLRAMRVRKVGISSEVNQRRNEEIIPEVQVQNPVPQAPQQVNIEPKAEPFKAAKVEVDLEKNELAEKEKVFDLKKIEEEEKEEEIPNEKPSQNVEENKDPKSINQILDQIDVEEIQ